MKKLFLIGLILLSVLAIQSCKPRAIFDDTQEDVLSIPINELTAPKDFDFSTHKDLYVRVAIKNPITPTTRYLIKIYKNVPGTGDLVKSGLTSTSNFEYATSIRVPAAQEFLWIEKINPDGTSQFNKVTASTFVSSMFDSKPENVYTFQKSGSGMDCSSSCDNSYNNHSGNLNFNGNQTICITGTFNGDLTVGSNVTVKICGSGTINNLTLNHKKSKVYILEGAQLKIGNLNLNDKEAQVKSWSDSVVVTGSLSLNGDVENNGNFYVNGSMTVNSNGAFTNYGLLSVGGSTTLNNDVDNYNFMNVGGSLTVNSNTEFKSYCKLNIGGSLTVNDKMQIKGLTNVVGAITINSNGEVKLDDEAMLIGDDFTLNGQIEGKGSGTNIVKIADRTVINGNGELKGTINLCDADGIENNFGKISSPAKASCDGSLPVTTCNPIGFNVVTVQDDDNDGVANAQDAYPNDADRAFDSYYPAANEFVNIAFEDLWPFTGDFDFNDMVIAYNMKKVLNADNKVVDVKFKVQVKAVGGSYDNGFGFRLDDVQTSEIATITGYVLSKNIVTLNANKTEAAQDRAVIICFDSPEPTLNRAAGSFFNTIPTNAKGTSDTINIDVSFTTPIDESKLAAEKLNPFIFTNGRRGYEVHLADFAPTSLADNALFGTGQDASAPQNNKYYKTANNLPWAIVIEENFDYPIEREPINVAYTYFNQWAISGGAQKGNWYRNLAQYRKSEKIFER